MCTRVGQVHGVAHWKAWQTGKGLATQHDTTHLTMGLSKLRPLIKSLKILSLTICMDQNSHLFLKFNKKITKTTSRGSCFTGVRLFHGDLENDDIINLDQ